MRAASSRRPAFGHEVIKRAVTAALPKGDADRKAMSELLKKLVLRKWSSTNASEGGLRA